MKIILTNDDGIDAPGIEVLFQVLRDFGTVIVVAPSQPESWISHQVTTKRPIRVTRLDDNRYSVDAKPADCSRIALKVIAPDADWVVSGINRGANLGSDVYNSGTVAAAREACILGCKSLALSQYIAKDHTVDWEITRHHTIPVIHRLLNKRLDSGYFWNVNLPHPLTLDKQLIHMYCILDTNPHAYKYRIDGNEYSYEGTIHDRPRLSGTDVDICFRGSVSITRLSINCSDRGLLHVKSKGRNSDKKGDR